MEIAIQTTLEVFDWSIWYYHFPIDEETTNAFKKEGCSRVICEINGTEKMHSALMPLESGSYIMVNKRIRETLGLIEGDAVQLLLTEDNSKYGSPMPESLAVMLDQDQEGAQHFHNLTPGKQRSLIYIVSKVKSIDKQINKALAILEHLKDVKGKLDFKLLNLKIKEFNNR